MALGFNPYTFRNCDKLPKLSERSEFAFSFNSTSSGSASTCVWDAMINQRKLIHGEIFRDF